MYQTWLKERENWIKQVRENDTLLEEIVVLKEKLTIKIMSETLKNKKEKEE